MTRIALLFPGALGDFVCLIPTIEALRACAEELTLIARPDWMDLLDPRRLRFVSIDRREVADLFGSGDIARSTRELFAGHSRVLSWTGAGHVNFVRRLNEASGIDPEVFEFRGMRAGEHAAEYYARCARVTRVVSRAPVRPEAARWSVEFWHANRLGNAVLAIHAGSGSAVKNWEGMVDVSSWWRRHGGQVLSVRGPAEGERPVPIEHDAMLDNPSLSRVASTLHRAAFYLGNDSGISHVAGYVGVRGVALFGPSDPSIWHPLGESVQVLAATQPCLECAPRFCTHRIAVTEVLKRLRANVLSHVDLSGPRA